MGARGRVQDLKFFEFENLAHSSELVRLPTFPCMERKSAGEKSCAERVAVDPILLDELTCTGAIG